MATTSDQEVTLARVYSEAMLRVAETQGEADSFLEELLDLSAYLDATPALVTFFSSPTVDTEVRQKAIENWFRGRASDLLVDSLQVLNRKGRLGLLRAVVETYRLGHEELRGQIDVHVRTAAPLSEAVRARLKEVASAHTGKEAKLIERVDESILGGMIVRIGDEKLDTSVATRLAKLGRILAVRASAEIHCGKSYFTEMAS